MATKKKAKKNKGLSIAIIILIVLIIFILLIVKKDIIITNLKETNFFGRVFGATPEFVEKHKSSEKTSADINTESTVTIKVETEKKPEQPQKDTSSEKKSEQTKTETKEKTESKASAVESEKTQNNAAQKEAEKTSATEETKAEAKTQNKTATEVPKKQTTEVAYTELQLYFIEIDADGSVIRKNVKRTIPKNDSPLVTALNLLLAGPDTTKTAEKNCMSLIPEGTKLLGAKVQNGIAYLDFSENFEFNSYGVEGYNGQLMQIVYTATNFSTVKSVQFLIEGKKKEYLGSEGQWIGSPLSRSAF